MTELRTYHGKMRPYDPLSNADAQKIIDAVFQLMHETGVKFDPEPRALELLSGAGCEISPDGIVKFPPALVKQSLDSVGRRVELWNRSANERIDFSVGNTIFMAGVTCPNVVDPETGDQRPATREDIAIISRVADALPDIDGVCLPCKISDKPDVYGQIEEFATLVENTSKPLTYLCEDSIALEAAIEIARAVREGRDRLREKPYFSFMVTPLPLYYAKQHIEHIFLCIENGIPLFPATTSIGGASAPVTIAGSLVQCLATDFACIVLSQLIETGSFCACGSVPVFMDPATAELGGLPEMALAELARRQVLRALGLVNAGGTAGSCAGRKEFDKYNLSIATHTMLQAFYSQPGYCWCLGSIDSLMAYSLHALLYCHDLVGWVRRMWKGIRVDDETLALHVIREVGPAGDYLAETHTARHCRTEMWDPRYFHLAWEEDSEGQHANRKQMMHVIDKDLRKLLANHRPEPLPESLKDRLHSIYKKYGVI